MKEMTGWYGVLIQQAPPPILHDDDMIGCNYDKKEGDDRLMWHTYTASQPPILHDYNMIRCYHDKKEGDDRLI
eukprot:1087947-Ditylum_brightwellii.AAC.1